MPLWVIIIFIAALPQFIACFIVMFSLTILLNKLYGDRPEKFGENIQTRPVACSRAAVK